MIQPTVLISHPNWVTQWQFRPFHNASCANEAFPKPCDTVIPLLKKGVSLQVLQAGFKGVMPGTGNTKQSQHNKI